MSNLKNKKIALVYDRVNKWGGAERVLLVLRELFPDAPLFTSVYHSSTARWAEVFNIYTSWLQQVPLSTKHHEAIPFLMPLAFESFSFDDFDLVISISSEAAKGIITKPSTMHICYCLTPTRYLWSGHNEYFTNKLFRILSKPIVTYLKKWDVVAGKRPDAFIAISEEVQQRIKKYYQEEAKVVYPPTGLENSKFKIQNSKLRLKEGNYFLVVSRLVPYKRVDLAIKACKELGVPLKVIGSGSELAKLKRMATSQIEFLSNLTDAEVAEYYKNCRALIFPGHEDFGLSIVEAQSFGKPVIAYKAGGALETVIDGKTGLFFTPQIKEALKKTIKTFDTKQFKKEDCIDNAKRFDPTVFKERFLEEIEKILNR